MKVSDYIVEFLINKGITDVFGYPGGMVTQLMDSFGQYKKDISAHVVYHEQGAAFAACGYAQTSGKPGVAYATSGPGATNLVTGIANAFFDSIPTIFITGQVNSNESKGTLKVRQRGFQETDIVSIVKPITKYSAYIDKAESLPQQLNKAYQIAISGRKGPVLLDIPMNVFRTEIGESLIEEDVSEHKNGNVQLFVETCTKELNNASSPVLLIGAGVKSVLTAEKTRKMAKKLNLPVVSSMVAFDVMKDDPLYYGFVGAYGTRAANFLVAKSDLIIAIGSRLDIRQVGAKRNNFAPNAKIIRIDIDEGELEYKVHEDEIQFCMDVNIAIDALNELKTNRSFSRWLSICEEIKNLLKDQDNNAITQMIKTISKLVPDEAVITTDVGQNQVWIAQSFQVKQNQSVLFSGGHGAMGYSLPAAIGAYYGSQRKPIFCFTGDGGLQMNIQELQLVAREKIPIKIFVFNNFALGMIRHFQEMYFESRYVQTKAEGGYTSPDFSRLAEAYGISSRRIEMGDLSGLLLKEGPELIEVLIREDTYVTPKLEFGKPNQDQEPLINRELYYRIMEIKP